MTVQAQEVQAEIKGDAPGTSARRQELYEEAVAAHAAALGRLARDYEADSERCRDLLQEIHVALWASLAGFNARCSLRTWVYRVAHNVACTHTLRARRHRTASMVSLDQLAIMSTEEGGEAITDRRIALERLSG